MTLEFAASEAQKEAGAPQALDETVAAALWSSPERLERRIEAELSPEALAGSVPELLADTAPGAPTMAVQDVPAAPTPEYLARVSHALNQLRSESITFVTGPQADSEDQLPQAWWDATGRLAWLLWLGRRRQISRTHEVFERLEWNYDAPAYRDYVRNVVRQLRARGIHLQ